MLSATYPPPIPQFFLLVTPLWERGISSDNRWALSTEQRLSINPRSGEDFQRPVLRDRWPSKWMAYDSSYYCVDVYGGVNLHKGNMCLLLPIPAFALSVVVETKEYASTYQVLSRKRTTSIPKLPSISGEHQVQPSPPLDGSDTPWCAATSRGGPCFDDSLAPRV